jgi:alpha-L-arabinofuranosidase
VNTHPNQTVELDLEIYQAKVDEVELVSLSSNDIHAHNTFDSPDTVRLSTSRTIKGQDNHLRATLPAGSVTRFIGQLVQ